MQNLTITVLLLIVFVVYPLILLDSACENMDREKLYAVEVQYSKARPKGHKVTKVSYKKSCSCHWKGNHGSLSNDSTKDYTKVPEVDHLGSSGYNGVRIDGGSADLYQETATSNRHTVEVQ